MDSYDRERIVIPVNDFNYRECLVYLNRNENEVLHQINHKEASIMKVIKVDQKPVFFKIEREDRGLVVSFPQGVPSKEVKSAVEHYIMDWFDLSRNLNPFYSMAEKDPILQRVVSAYKGLRIVGVDDLFEALCWSIMGQQISLHVAYLLKKRFVEAFGEHHMFDKHTYWSFPTAERMATVNIEELIPLKFTQRKAEYILGVAQLITEGKLTKQYLEQLDGLNEIERYLTSIRGIGKWSANYVMMRCLRYPEAFPIADVGLHNAIRRVLELDQKPSIGEIAEWTGHWGQWKAYATFYLWRSLLPAT